MEKIQTALPRACSWHDKEWHVSSTRVCGALALLSGVSTSLRTTPVLKWSLKRKLSNLCYCARDI